MRFPWSFTRVVGGEGIELGSDEAPAGALNERELAIESRKGNVLHARQANTMGWPVQRIAVAWAGPLTATRPIDLLGYVLDHRTGLWLATTPVMGALARHLYWLDAPALLDAPTASGRTGMVTGPQPLEVMMIPRSTGEMPEGTYTFVMGADVSNTP